MSSRRLGHRPRLDGVRGLAILVVMAGHGIPLLRGAGSVGVGLFFVLSGFLITKLLLEEDEVRESIAFRRFYFRRALRLYPALIVVIVVFLAVAFSGALPTERATATLGAVAAAFYLTDALTILAPHLLGGLQFTWSLAVEEQFYLLWPAGLALILRLSKRNLHHVASVIGWVIVVAVGLRLAVWQVASVHFTPFEWSDALLLGCLAALLVHDGRLDGARLPRWTGFVAAVPMVWLSVRGFHRIDNLWTVTILALGHAAIVTMATAPARGRADVLGWKPFVFMGRISYGLYLWHSVLDEIMLASSPAMSIALRAAIMWLGGLLLATLSYRYVEQPFLRMKDRQAA